MRNDEKIDINLTKEISTDHLSEEETAKLHYETAFRYINIADHMKKFEDQDKYYHRAIQYLRRARPYKYDRNLIRELKKKKFTLRAQGKIALYKEACGIMAKAKTPNDYYSAQTIFYRIHQYEQNHPLAENWTTPELFAEASQCSDSEEKIKLCEKLANEKTAQLKRHSLFVSFLVILGIAAVLLFVRTTAFRQCLADFYSATGDYEGAYQNYDEIRKKTNSTQAYEKYLVYRYKNALKAISEGDMDTAYRDLKALAKDNYRDSRTRFIELEQDHVKQTKIGKVVSFGRVRWRVLDHKDGKTLLLKDKAIGSTPFNENGGKTTWESSSVREWLNSSFLKETFYNGEKNLIEKTTVTNTPNSAYKTDAGKDTVDQIFLLSYDEVVRYYDAIHHTATCWWLRTPGATNSSMCFVYRDKTIMDYGYEVSNQKITVKPAIWVDTES